MIDYPRIIKIPFANEGEKNEIPENRSEDMKANRATLSSGFPNITMQPIAAGGMPPSGKDMNGILNLLSQHVVYQNSGGLYKFNSELCAAVGGYPKGAVLIDNAGDKCYQSLHDSNSVNFNIDDPSGHWKIFVLAQTAATVHSGVPIEGTTTVTPNGVLIVEIIGGGAGGNSGHGGFTGTASAGMLCGGAGGASGEFKTVVIATTEAVTITVDSIGAGGAGGTGWAKTNGDAGGDTIVTINGVKYTARGGVGGVSYPTLSVPFLGRPAPIPDGVRMYPGGSSVTLTSGFATGGCGGGQGGGSSTQNGNGGGPGGDGTWYGAGGGGGSVYSTNMDFSGGAGHAGAVLLWY